MAGKTSKKGKKGGAGKTKESYSRILQRIKKPSLADRIRGGFGGALASVMSRLKRKKTKPGKEPEPEELDDLELEDVGIDVVEVDGELPADVVVPPAPPSAAPPKTLSPPSGELPAEEPEEPVKADPTDDDEWAAWADNEEPRKKRFSLPGGRRGLALLALLLAAAGAGGYYFFLAEEPAPPSRPRPARTADAAPPRRSRKPAPVAEGGSSAATPDAAPAPQAATGGPPSPAPAPQPAASVSYTARSPDDPALAGFAGLENLEYLDISGTSGAVSLDGIEKLQALRTLKMRGKDDLDADALRRLAALPNLTHLDLSECNRFDAEIIAVLTGLKSLRILELNGVYLDRERVRLLTGMTGLRELGISSFFVDDEALGLFSSMLNLRFLQIGPMQIEDVGNLSVLNGLTRLSVESLDYGDNERIIPSLGNIRGLAIRNGYVTRTGLANLCRMINLRYLHLGVVIEGAGYDYPEIANLNALEYLRVRQISDAGLTNLSELGNLVYLDLSEASGFSDQGMAAVASMPRLEILRMAPFPNGRYTQQSLQNLAKSIGALEINAHISDLSALEALRGLPELTVLSGSFPPESWETLFAVVRDLPRLKRLHNRNNIPEMAAELAKVRPDVQLTMDSDMAEASFHQLATDGLGIEENRP